MRRWTRHSVRLPPRSWVRLRCRPSRPLTLLPMRRRPRHLSGVAPPDSGAPGLRCVFRLRLVSVSAARRDRTVGPELEAPHARGRDYERGLHGVYVGQPIADPRVAHIVGCALAALSMWLLIFGIVGAFVALLGAIPPRRPLSLGCVVLDVHHPPAVRSRRARLARALLPASRREVRLHAHRGQRHLAGLVSLPRAIHRAGRALERATVSARPAEGTTNG